jgi:hypothetical protein
MSTINITGSSLKSTTIPGAFLETCLLLDAAEKSRNGANPGIAPKNNVSIAIATDEGVATITASLPADVTVSALGVQYNAKDYLGGVYADFTAGGDLTSTTAMDALVQVASLLAAAEKNIQPVEDQPNNVQVESSSESGTITVSATLPVTTTINTDGTIKIVAIDYL